MSLPFPEPCHTVVKSNFKCHTEEDAVHIDRGDGVYHQEIAMKSALRYALLSLLMCAPAHAYEIESGPVIACVTRQSRSSDLFNCSKESSSSRSTLSIPRSTTRVLAPSSMWPMC